MLLKFILIVMSPFTIYLLPGTAIGYVHSTICSHVWVTMHFADQRIDVAIFVHEDVLHAVRVPAAFSGHPPQCEVNV